MTRCRFLSVVAVGVALFAAPVAPAFSQDAPTTDPTVTTDTTTTVRMFDDTDLLIETMMADDLAELDTAAIAEIQTLLDTAEEDLQAALDAQALLDPAAATNEERAAAQAAVDTAQGTVDGFQVEFDTASGGIAMEQAEVEALVALLSPEQIFALNRSLNNAIHNPFGANIDAVHLQMILDGDYNRQQINMLTKALESEAKFLYLAEKTGNDSFLDKAVTQKQKFMVKIGKFADETETTDVTETSGTTDVTETSGGDATGDTVRAVSIGAAKQLAKGASRRTAKQTAKGAAKRAAKAAAKQAAKAAVKQSIKSQARKAAKGKKS